MGKIDKELAIAMRRDGATNEEIAEYFGVSQQAVQQRLKNCIHARKDGNAIEKIPYDGLYEFMLAHPRVTINYLAGIMYGGASDHARAEKVRRFMQGKYACLPKIAYDNLIKYTGMTYEQLFEPREGFEEEDDG